MGLWLNLNPFSLPENFTSSIISSYLVLLVFQGKTLSDKTKEEV